MLYFDYGLKTVCNDESSTGFASYLTFITKSQAKEWLHKHNYCEYKDFPGVWFNFKNPTSFAEYKIRKFLNLPYYGVVCENHNKREFLHNMD